MSILSHNDVIAQFCDAMRAAGLIVNASDIVTDSPKFQRCKSEKDRGARKNGYYKLWLDGRPAGVFGIWSTGESHTWSADTGAAPMSAEEQAKLRAQMKRKQAERAAEIKEGQNKAAERAKKIWDKAVPADASHPYLARKGVNAHGLRVGKWWKWDGETGKPYVACENALLVPMYGLKRDIRSLQAIFPGKVEIYGDLRDKDYLSSGERLGVFHVLGRPQEIDGRKVVIVAEGYATGASIHEATGHCVLVAFDTNNLLPTAQVFRDKYPEAVIVFAADNDQFTVVPINNPGVHYARKAAAAVGGLVAIPQFDDLDGKPTDFNDLAEREGAGAVEAWINAALYSAEHEPMHELKEDSADAQDAYTGKQGGAYAAMPLPACGQPDNVQRTSTAQRDGVKLGGITQGADKPLLSPAARTYLDSMLSALNDAGPWPMGKSGDMHGFLSHRKEVVFLRPADLFRDHGILELQSLNAWEYFCTAQGKKATKDGEEGKRGAARAFDRTLIGNYLLDLSAIVGDFNYLHVPANVMHPDVLARKVAIAEMRVRPSAQSISHFLMIDTAWKGVVWANTFADRVEARSEPPCGGGAGPWTDNHTMRLSAWLTASFKLKELSNRAVDGAVSLLALADQQHPVHAYLRGLKWDGVQRLDTWTRDYAGVDDTTIARAFASKSLISMCARIMVPGSKVDTVPILEGPQGLKKSTLIKALMHDGDWFTDSLDGNLGDKDAAIGLRGKWAVEVPEMAAAERTGAKTAKAFFSRSTDHYRSPFGIKAQDHPRSCVFWGSVNPEGDGSYLTDTTGARRYWPVLMTRIDVADLEAARDQIWAEAFHRYNAREQWWLPPELEVLAKVEQADRTEGNTWDVYVHKFITMGPVPGDRGVGWIARKEPMTQVTTAEIFETFTSRILGKKDRAESTSICTALKTAGWTQVNLGARGGRVWRSKHWAGNDERGSPV